MPNISFLLSRNKVESSPVRTGSFNIYPVGIEGIIVWNIGLAQLFFLSAGQEF